MADEKTIDEVEVVKGFRNGQIGDKEAGDRFPYDLKKDPLGLKALGLVKAAPATAPKA